MTERERLTTERRKIFARESLTLMSMTKEELRQHYNEIFDRLQEYEVAEENNQIIVPPCKVGDTVYILAGPNGHKYEKDICEGFYIGDDGVVQVRTRNNKGNHSTYGVIGETIFLTKEEVEKALHKIKHNSLCETETFKIDS